MCDQDWVEVAMADDSLVVELLLRLHQAQPSPPPVKSRTTPPCLHLDWTVRQRRSRSVSRHVDGAQKKAEQTRASPTTPLSWSGATSASGVDGYEESSRLTKPLENSRSKVRCNFSVLLFVNSNFLFVAFLRWQFSGRQHVWCIRLGCVSVKRCVSYSGRSFGVVSDIFYFKLAEMPSRITIIYLDETSPRSAGRVAFG